MRPLGVQLSAMWISVICLDLHSSLTTHTCVARRKCSLTVLERKRPNADVQTFVYITFKKCPSWRLDFAKCPSQAWFADSQAGHPCPQRTTPKTR